MNYSIVYFRELSILSAIFVNPLENLTPTKSVVYDTWKFPTFCDDHVVNRAFIPIPLLKEERRCRVLRWK